MEAIGLSEIYLSQLTAYVVITAAAAKLDPAQVEIQI